MLSSLIKIAKKYLPVRIKKYLYFLSRKNIFVYFKIKNYYKNKIAIRLLVGYEGRKPGWFSLGFSGQNDICFKVGGKLYIPSNSVEEIYVCNFIEYLDDDDLIFFLNECYRILKNKHRITISFLDHVRVFKQYFSDPKYFYQEKFWNKKHGFIKSTAVDIVSSIIFDNKKISRLTNIESLSQLLENLGFHIIDKNETGDLRSILTAEKSAMAIDKTSLGLIKGEIKNDKPIYLYNCDSLHIVDTFENININKLKNRNFASVIGSLFFINIIPYIKPKSVLLFDVNEYQVRYMKIFRQILLSSDSFEDFLQNFFSRKFYKDTKKFLRSKASKSILSKNREKVKDKEIFDMSIGKIAQAQYFLFQDILPALKIENNSMCSAITVLEKELFIPSPALNVVYTQKGIAEHFNYIKNILRKAKIEKLKLEDERVYNFIKNQGIVYVSNIGENNWLYDDWCDLDLETNILISKLLHFPSSFKKQLTDSYKGFHSFINNIKDNFWIIDSAGNIFSSYRLLQERVDSHQWLWQKIEPLIIGKTIEIIHAEDNTWGFHEHLVTKNVLKYIQKYKNKGFDTIVFHLLLSNGVNIQIFLEALKIASRNSKRLIILEHDRDSINFGIYSGENIIDIRRLLRILRSVPEVEKGEIKVYWSGSSYRVDEKIYGNKSNFNRNLIITIDL